MLDDFAQIQNEVLERNGFSICVDHRMLEAQKEEAERNGDTFLARLFNRILEEYIGVISCKDDDDEQLKRLERFRSLRKQHFDLLMKLDSTTKEADELAVKDSVQNASTSAKALMDSNEYANQKFASENLQELRAKILVAIAEVNKWKRVIISQHDAELHAKLEYMTKAERALWHKYFDTLAQKKHLEDFLQPLRKPDQKHKESFQAYNDLVAASILRKNYKFVRQLEEVETYANQLAQRLNHAKEQIDCLKLQLSSEQHTTYYKVSSDGGTLNSLASLIADAILHDPQVVQLVALSDDNCLEMKKDWELMSELDKEALIRKKIIREL